MIDVAVTISGTPGGAAEARSSSKKRNKEHDEGEGRGGGGIADTASHAPCPLSAAQACVARTACFPDLSNWEMSASNAAVPGEQIQLRKTHFLEYCPCYSSQQLKVFKRGNHATL